MKGIARIFLSLNSFFLPKYVVPRFWGCKPEIPESGINLDNIANSGNHIVSLLLGARTWAAKFRCFGTDCLWWRSPFSLKLFHARDNGHQVVLSWLSVFEWNCASKIGAITVHLSNFSVNCPTLFSLKNHRFLDPQTADTSRENRNSRSIFRDIDKPSHPLNFKQLESMSLKYSDA